MFTNYRNLIKYKFTKLSLQIESILSKGYLEMVHFVEVLESCQQTTCYGIIKIKIQTNWKFCKINKIRKNKNDLSKI